MERARRSESLTEEMELHLEQRAAELQANGMTPECARAEARRLFGNVGEPRRERPAGRLAAGRRLHVARRNSLTEGQP